MSTVTSTDGTRIAFERVGDGPPLILVVGAFNDRSTGRPLAESLASRFSVFTYDRRGRGDSGDTLPYAVDREIEDLAVLIAAAGGSACVFGYSSGAMLALHAAARGLPVSRLVLYDAPYLLEPMASPTHHAARLADLIAAGRRGEAVEYFQRDLVGIPAEVVAQLRHAPFRPALEAIAHTLVYDATIVGDGALPTALLPTVRMPTLVIAGGAGPAFMQATARALAEQLPSGQVHILPDQGHDLAPSALRPVLETFLLSPE